MIDKLKEECGVFGIFQNRDAAVLTQLGLHALQHRGQEGAGIVSCDGNEFVSIRKKGLVSDNFNKLKTLKKLKGNSAIGHVRYSTAGGSIKENIQPLFANLADGGFACAHNGNLINANHLREKLTKRGSIFQTTSDTETILQLVARSKELSVEKKIIDAIDKIKGAFSLVILTKDKMYGIKDPFGIRPLVIGKIKNSFILASETCALDMIGAKYFRDVENGEIVEISIHGIRSIKPFDNINERPCIFERIYFSRPDSLIKGKTVYSYRKQLGVRLANEKKLKADVVMPIMDSGTPAALGFSQKSNIPFEIGIIRSHYVGRTFIEPEQSIRQFGVKLKHSINETFVKNKKIILIDDSIVRGTTAKKIVKMLFEKDAIEVHLGISCPPIKHPDFYGIDTPDYKELLAYEKNIEQMNKYIGSTSLFFLSLDGTYKAFGFSNRNKNQPQLTDHCFTGDYPV
ncbi:MAG: amidophosphoribosyltransferase [Candidatus Puniceispirillales bacterium]